MTNLIEQFMWGFQGHFATAIEITVEEVMEALGRPTEPVVFLIGFLEPGGTRKPICIEPEDGPLVPRDFERTAARADAIYADDPYKDYWNSDPRTDELFQIGLREKAWADAIREVLEERLDKDFYVASPVVVEQHKVFPVIGLERAVSAAFPTLKRQKVDDSRIVLDRSILEAAMGPLMGFVSRALYQPDAGSHFGSLVDAHEITRLGAESLIAGAAYRADQERPAHGLWDALNRLATSTYERRIGTGRIILASPASEDISRALTLEKPVKMSETRTARKLLEMASTEGIALLTDGRAAFGLGNSNPEYDATSESIFEIHVTGPGSWDLRHADEPLMSVTYGSPHLPAPPLTRAEFDTLAQRLFGPTGGCDADRLWELAQAAADADHGTMLVVSESAAAEAQRLGAQALLVQPVAPSVSLIRQVTSIDGAVLVDPTASLHAIGVILDGVATTEGDRARGARFNSAIRYLSAATSPTLIVLVSEDGTLDLLPLLRPQISRSDLEAKLESLRTAAAIEPVVSQAFYGAFRPVKAAAFYLSRIQCEEVNRLVADHQRRRESSGSWITFIEQPLTPDPRMSDEYFLD